MRLTANKIAGILRQHGYRLTPQRHAVLKTIAGSHDHLTPAEIYAQVHREHPTVGLATVYRVINLLSELNMIESQTPPFDYPMPAAYARGKLLTYSDKPFSSKSGIVRFLAGPGDEVKNGQPLAKIVNAFGKHLETVVATQNALVLGHADSSVVFPGMPIMAFGLTSTKH